MEFGISFNSKLLLFGEYGLMFDAMALSVPFSRFCGQLAFDGEGEHRRSTAEIRKFYEHLKVEEANRTLHFSFNLEKMESDLQRGLYFSSNIPQRYGVGSSGALVAALFHQYAFPAEMGSNLSPEILKTNFALLESFFHGRSSGLDPLISYMNKPLIIDLKKNIVPVDFDLNKTGVAMALIDTKTSGATGPLVQHFINLFNLQEFKTAFENQFIPSNNASIDSLLKGDTENFYLNLEQLIRFQVYHFHQMIPIGFHRVISNALRKKVYIKLLGSGGGGFLLVFADSKDRLEKWAIKEKISINYIKGLV